MCFLIPTLITKEMFEEILKGDNWYVAEADGKVVGAVVHNAGDIRLDGVKQSGTGDPDLIL